MSTLTRVLGVQQLDLVEDVVQAAFLEALRSWAVRGVPENPSAWLLRVARNLALDALRRDKVWRTKLRSQVARSELDDDSILERVSQVDEIADDQLRMLALCCHPSLPPASQIALALRMLCGFSAAEIAKGLLTSEAHAQKWIERAKERLRDEVPWEVDSRALPERLDRIHSVIYLLFNEGYHASRAETVVRGELCAEALRLGALLAAHEACRTPATCALQALMLLHAARFATRETADGRLLLLDEQDRREWDRGLIGQGLKWLAESAQGDALSIYHLEAGIAAEHALAETFADTNWPRILQLYDLLIRVQPSAVHRLNCGIAVAFVHGPQAALNAIAQIPAAEIPTNYHLWDATLGELHRRAGHGPAAREHFERALQRSPSPAEQALLRARLASLGN